MVNPSVVFWPVCVCIDDGVRVWVGPCQIFSSVEGLKIEF